MSAFNTWRALGLSVAIGYAGLGTIAVIKPSFAGDALLGLKRAISPVHDKPLLTAIRLLGARDVSIAAALFVFDWYGRTQAMGQLILCGMVLCAADVYTGLVGHDPQQGLLLAVGASAWAFIGYGLARGNQ